MVSFFSEANQSNSKPAEPMVTNPHQFPGAIPCTEKTAGDLWNDNNP